MPLDEKLFTTVSTALHHNLNQYIETFHEEMARQKQLQVPQLLQWTKNNNKRSKATAMNYN